MKRIINGIEYFVCDSFTPEIVQIASYIQDDYTRGQLALIKDNGKWLCRTEEWWPGVRGGSNGGLIDEEINKDLLYRYDKRK